MVNACKLVKNFHSRGGRGGYESEYSSYRIYKSLTYLNSKGIQNLFLFFIINYSPILHHDKVQPQY